MMAVKDHSTFDHEIAAKSYRIFAAKLDRERVRAELAACPPDLLADVAVVADQADMRAEARRLLHEWEVEEHRADMAALRYANGLDGPTYAEVMLSRYGARV